MGVHGKGMVGLSTQTQSERRDYIDARAAVMGWTRSELLSLMIERWLADGAPALTDLEAKVGTIPVPRKVISGIPAHAFRVQP